MRTRQIRVSGRVQGVGYRYALRDEARRLGVKGWVRNRADGSVEVEAQGEAAALDDLLAFLHRGPLGAHVDSVTVDWLPPGEARETFEVRRTS